MIGRVGIKRFAILAGLLLWVGLAFGQVADSVSSINRLLIEEPVNLDSVPDSMRVVADVPADSLVAVQDSAGPKKKKDALEDPVIYESNDSMIWNNGGYASLYGDGKVNYQNVQLTAAVIKMQMDSSLVYADGVQDSLGQWKGLPVFLDGSTPYESNHISYNFKTEKGYIHEITTQQGEGYMTSTQAKKGPEGEYFVEDAIYTTCDQHDDPHFGIRITRAKVRPGRDVVFGPAYLEVMGVPLPLFVPFGFFPFFFAIAIGCVIGAFKIPGINFSLGNSGGCLVAGLIVGHFGHLGGIDLRIEKNTLNFMRELGLVLFLIGAGVPGGVNFVNSVKASYFIYGIVMTTVPMLIGYFLATKVFKIDLLNSLGSITGGMTSTPALGALIATAGTDEVAGAYAATYPVALVCVVIMAKVLLMLS